MKTAAQISQEVGDRIDPQAAFLRKEREKKDLLVREQRKQDMLFMMNNKQCRRFLYSLLEKTGTRGSVLQAGKASDVLAGRMEVGRELEAELVSTDIDAYLAMLKEALEDRSNAKKA